MQQPENAVKGGDERQPDFTAFRRGFQQHLIISSLGEYFLPFFLAAIEACWINGVLIGLAGVGLLDTYSALMPFWGPPLLLLTSLWLFRRALQKEEHAPEGDAETASTKNPLQMTGLGSMAAVIGLLTIILIWWRVYSPTNFLLDPGWLLAFGEDLLSLNAHFYQALFIAALAIFLCWRSIYLAQLRVEPGHVFRRIWIGLLILLAAILLRAKQASVNGNADDVVLLLLLPIFLYLSLSAHALARITFIRREHPFGLEGSVTAQERAMLSVIAIVGIILLGFTVIGGNLFSPAFFNSLQPLWRAVIAAYDLLARAFSQLATWLVTPFFGLFNLIFHNGFAQIRPVKGVAQNPRTPHVPTIGPTSPAIVLATRILLPLLIFLVLLLLLRLALRRRKRVRVSLNRKGGEIRESVWSWTLFWGQVRALFWAFFRRFFPQQAGSEEQAAQTEELPISPTMRSIREIYRALLKKAAARGHARKRNETPHEFRQRLNEHETQNEPQLGMLTDAYALVRYGGTVPLEHDVAAMRGLWNELEHRWDTLP